MVLGCWGRSPWSKSTRNSVEKAIFVKVYFASLGMLNTKILLDPGIPEVSDVWVWVSPIESLGDFLQTANGANWWPNFEPTHVVLPIFMWCHRFNHIEFVFISTAPEITQVLDSIAWGGSVVPLAMFKINYSLRKTLTMMLGFELKMRFCCMLACCRSCQRNWGQSKTFER